jgi:ubiquinol-cytochrome c reductase cytochrome b subunit
MFSAILILLLLPITDVSRSRGMQFRPLSKIAFYIFIANFLILMQLGAKHVESPFIEFGQISTVLYFFYFTVVMYTITLIENTFVDIRYLKFIEHGIIKNNYNKKREYHYNRLFVATQYDRGALDYNIQLTRLLEFENDEEYINCAKKYFYHYGIKYNILEDDIRNNAVILINRKIKEDLQLLHGYNDT